VADSQRDTLSGVAIGSIAFGALFAYAGIKGYSIPATLKKLITGQSPLGQAQTAGLTSTAGETGVTTTTSAASSSTAASTPAAVAAGVSVAEGGTSETQFQTAMLKDLGAPVTSANLSSLHSWFLHEEPSFPPPNAWNPLNIESGGGFAQYGSASAGAAATAAFIEDNNYNEIRMALLSGNGLCGGSCASDFLRWSGNGYSSVC
jgi:hypothetical protein